jgi:hypothetical protein
VDGWMGDEWFHSAPLQFGTELLIARRYCKQVHSGDPKGPPKIICFTRMEASDGRKQVGLAQIF